MSDHPEADPPTTARGPSNARRLLVCFLAVPAGLLATELAMRFLLFSPSGLARSLGADLRHAEYFVPPATDDYWKLEYLFRRPEGVWAPGERTHPRLGWLSENIDPVTFENEDARFVGDRRPVLLYGSSQAKYFGAIELRYRQLLEESDLADRFALVNYAVGAHGLCQELLLFESSVELYRERRPVVVFTVMIDTDLDRCTLGFYHRPKPRFTLDEHDRLVIHEPGTDDTERYLEAHPVGVTSYFWSYVRHGTVLSSRTSAQGASKRQALDMRLRLLRPILERVSRRCDELDAELFVVILQSRERVVNAEEGERARTLRHVLTDLGIPYVAAAPMLRAAAAAAGRSRADFYLPWKAGGHPNELGMRAIFQAYRRGLEGDFDSPEPVAGPLR